MIRGHATDLNQRPFDLGRHITIIGLAQQTNAGPNREFVVDRLNIVQSGNRVTSGFLLGLVQHLPGQQDPAIKAHHIDRRGITNRLQQALR